MVSAEQFLIEFTKDIIQHPMDRKTLIAGWAKHLEARELDIRKDELQRVDIGINDAARIITPTAGARELNYYDFDYYRYLRNCELNGEEPLPTYEAYVESQR